LNTSFLEHLGRRKDRPGSTVESDIPGPFNVTDLVSDFEFRSYAPNLEDTGVGSLVNTAAWNSELLATVLKILREGIV